MADSFTVEHFAPKQPSLRVALVTETYPPEVNGVAFTVEQVVRGLQDQCHQVQLIRPRQPNADGRIDSASHEQVLMRGWQIPRYPHLRMGVPAKKALHALWVQRRPDVVHIATEGPLGWSALRAARKLRLPVTTDFRTNFHAYSRYYGMGWLKKPITAYLRQFHNQADRTMVPTAGLMDELTALRFERLLVVSRGIDAQRFHPQHRSTELRASWGVQAHEPVVLSVGRLAPEKNLDLLVQAYQAMRTVNPALRLVVVGDGPSYDEVRQRCPDALLVGEQRGDALARYYASADIFLFPSLTETYGNVTPEAMASGLAVVAFDYAAAAELIRHGENGLLAARDDAAAFVRRATDLAVNPALLQALRQNARASTQARDWKRIVAQIEQVWHDLLGTQRVI